MCGARGSGSRKEHAITDWDLIVEDIHNAMQAIDQANSAARIRNHGSVDSFDGFNAQMQELSEHLSALKYALEHASTYTMDELIDVLSQTYSGRPAAYRRTQRINL